MKNYQKLSREEMKRVMGGSGYNSNNIYCNIGGEWQKQGDDGQCGGRSLFECTVHCDETHGTNCASCAQIAE